MRKFAIAAAAGTLSIGLAACSNYDESNEAYANDAEAADYADNGAAAGNYDTAGGGAGAAAGGSFPAGSRIVVEEGVTYRIDPGGVRVALGPGDSRIVVEDGVRYRIDPGGTRVRIDDSGAVIDVDTRVDGDTSVTVNTE